MKCDPTTSPVGKPLASDISDEQSGVPLDPFILYTEGDALYDAMLSAIDAAKSQVWLATYIFSADDVGRLFVAALTARARAGVEVRLTIDAMGSLFTFPNDLEQELLSQGVEVRRYLPWDWHRPFHYNRRDHRKLLVVDGEQAFLGGFNIHRQSSYRAVGAKRWRDTHIRTTGKLAVQAMELFDAFWNGDLNWSPPPEMTHHSELIPNYSRHCRQRLHCIYRDILNDARRYLYITTPYFVPDRRLQKGLIEAAKRGVDVRVLVPRKSDIPLVQWAARAAYANLLAHGVRVYEYLPRMLHAKTVVFDDVYTTIGSANMDYRSFFLNYEINLFSGDKKLCLQMRDQFCRDLLEAEEICASRWKLRHWGSRLLEWAGWKLRRWL